MRFILTIAFGSWFFCYDSEASEPQCLINDLNTQYIFNSDNTVIEQKIDMSSEPELGTRIPVTDDIDVILWKERSPTIIYCSDLTTCN